MGDGGGRGYLFCFSLKPNSLCLSWVLSLFCTFRSFARPFYSSLLPSLYPSSLSLPNRVIFTTSSILQYLIVHKHHSNPDRPSNHLCAAAVLGLFSTSVKRRSLFSLPCPQWRLNCGYCVVARQRFRHYESSPSSLSSYCDGPHNDIATGVPGNPRLPLTRTVLVCFGAQPRVHHP